MSPAPQPSINDLVHALNLVQSAERRWRRTAILASAGFVALFAVSFLQFWSTFMTCGLLEEARLEAGRAKQESAKTLAEVEKLRDQIHTAAVDVYDSRRETKELQQHLDVRLDQFRKLVKQSDEKAPQPMTAVFLKMVLNEIDDAQAKPAVEAALARLEKKLNQLQREDAKHWPIIINSSSMR